MQNMMIKKLNGKILCVPTIFLYPGTESLFSSKSLLGLKNTWSIITCNTSLQDSLEYSPEIQSA